MGNVPGTGRGADIMSELPKIETEGEGIVFGRVLGGGRFLKTLQCWHDSSMVVVKAYSNATEALLCENTASDWRVSGSASAESHTQMYCRSCGFPRHSALPFSCEHTCTAASASA